VYGHSIPSGSRGGKLREPEDCQTPEFAAQDRLPEAKPPQDRAEPLALEDKRSVHPRVELLVNTASQDQVLALLGGAEELMLTAYTFDQPDVIDSLIRHGVTRILADKGQSQGERTRLQRQSLLQVARAGIRVRLTSGTSIAEAYEGDRRGTSVGKSLKGIQHSKTLCLKGRVGSPSYMIVGSSNYTTSSRANVELGFLGVHPTTF